MNVCKAMADEQSAKLFNIHSGFDNLPSSNQNYFWLELAISSDCEIIQSLNPMNLCF